MHPVPVLIGLDKVGLDHGLYLPEVSRHPESSTGAPRPITPSMSVRTSCWVGDRRDSWVLSRRVRCPVYEDEVRRSEECSSWSQATEVALPLRPWSTGPDADCWQAGRGILGLETDDGTSCDRQPWWPGPTAPGYCLESVHESGQGRLAPAERGCRLTPPLLEL